MSTLGKPLLCRVGDYWHFAPLLKGGQIQLTIENFSTIFEARITLGEEFSVEIAPDEYVPLMAIYQLGRLARGEDLPNRRGMKALKTFGLIGATKRSKDAPPPAVTERGAAVVAVVLA